MRLVNHPLTGKQKNCLGKNRYTDRVGRKQSQLEILPQSYYQDLPSWHKMLSITIIPLSIPIKNSNILSSIYCVYLLSLLHLRCTVQSFDFDSERLVYQSESIKEKQKPQLLFYQREFSIWNWLTKY